MNYGNGFIEIAVRFFKRPLALHHTRSGYFTKFLNVGYHILL